MSGSCITIGASIQRTSIIPPSFSLARRLKTPAVSVSGRKHASPSATGLKSVSAASDAPSFSPQKEKIGVVVVDDEEEMRLMLHQMLEGSGDFTCVGSYRTAAESMVGIPGVSPQVVLMDIRMPGISGIECARQLKKMMPGVKIVMVTGVADPAAIAASSNAGSDGYVTKPFSPAQCLAAIRFALRQTATQPIRPTAKTETLTARENQFSLTERENAIMKELAKGLLYKEIADQMQVSVAKIRKQIHALYTRLQVSNRVEAIRAWSGEDKPKEDVDRP